MEPLNTHQVEAIAKAVAAQIRNVAPANKELWDLADCANYLKCSKRHFSDRISYHHSFPKPVPLPSDTGKNPHRRWYAKEVIKWAEGLR